MKIGFDARMINHSGIGTYSRAILKILTQDPALDFTVFGDLNKLANYPARKVLADFPIYSVKEQIFFPRLLSKNPVDVFHVPHYNAPLGYSGNLAVTVHDLIHLKYPPSKLAYLYARGMFEAVLRKAKRVIVDSLHTKNDILELIGIPEDKIRVVYPGVDEDFSPATSNTQEPYILYVGNFKPTKNVGVLVEAFLQARRKIPELRLILAGKDFMPEATRLHSQAPGVTVAGEVNKPKLLDLYRGARIFVFPSLYEGFGLPPLEAMACGTPVICSNAASLPEAVGDAAMKFDPHDPLPLSELIFGLWKDEAKRKELSQKGLARAAGFTWKKCAQQIQAVYAECAT
ncbi:MAG: hypothetical protein A2901_02635 [Elusimicrobia bacterium RIFCSPLOWO2_01_FULL_54_10]|nr:MAG: hypothetical protein A2901_02635 [Elusimicrobia bacterium RIFCSPLOWO2_01_FULL_54_10]